MKYFDLMNDTLKRWVKTKRFFILFPFTIIGFVLAGVYYVIIAAYLLLDLLRIQAESILARKENESNGANTVKHLIGFGIVVCFNLILCCLIIPLGVIYLLAVIFMMVSSLFMFRTNPFGFHTII